MTCLYCGKKLGFFSRFKDTPFCSEEHLRVHQEELERALMERLGSKASSRNRGLEELGDLGATPVRSMVGLEAALKQVERGPAAPSPAPPAEVPLRQPAPPPPSLAPLAPPAPVETVRPEAVQAEPARVKPEVTAPAPLQEEFVIERPEVRQALDLNRPEVPPSTFAIIVESDCFTPSLEGYELCAELPFEETEFLLEAESFEAAPFPASLAAPEMEEERGFGDPWVDFPQLPQLSLQADISFEAEAVPLGYEAEATPFDMVMPGSREEIEPRIRFRFPYPASEVTSISNGLVRIEETFPLAEATDWEADAPSASGELEIAEPAPEWESKSPSVDVPLSIAGLLEFTLFGADSEDFGDTFEFHARPLGSGGTIVPDYGIEVWGSATALPQPSVKAVLAGKWRAPRGRDRVAPVGFPSLFQLGPVLPPRPEALAG